MEIDWVTEVIDFLESEGIRQVTGVPLLVLSQYDLEGVGLLNDADRVIAVSKVYEDICTLVQVWQGNGTYTVHVMHCDRHDITLPTRGFCIPGVSGTTARDIIGDVIGMPSLGLTTAG